MISIGATDLAMASIGDTDLAAISLGDTVLWTAATPIIPSRSYMDDIYPASVQIPRNTWTNILADTHDYGDPLVDGRIITTGTGIAAVGVLVGWVGGENVSVAITINGTRVATASSDASIYANLNVRKGDAIGAQAHSTEASAADRAYDGVQITYGPEGTF